MPYKTFPPIVAVKSSATGALSCARASTVPLPPALPTEPASLGFGGGPIVGEWGAYPLIGLMPHKTFGFAGALISLKWAGGARPFQDFYCVKMLGAASRRRSAAARTILVVAKSACRRFRLFGKSGTRSLAPPLPTVTAPLGHGGNPWTKHFPPSAPSANGGLTR